MKEERDVLSAVGTPPRKRTWMQREVNKRKRKPLLRPLPNKRWTKTGNNRSGEEEEKDEQTLMNELKKFLKRDGGEAREGYRGGKTVSSI